MPLLLAGVTVLSLAVPATSTAAPADPVAVVAGPVTEAPDEAQAAAAARAQGRRVEVTGQRSETRSVFVEPNGVHTAEFSPEPVRVWTGVGWTPVDTTLEARPDGSVAAKATTAGVVLSGGGTGPLVRLSRGGKAMGWSWPGELPKPVLEGSLATYREVLPGVDLRMRVAADGVTQHLVIKNREAAGNPALARIRMDAKADGLDLRVHEDGAAELVDDAGTPVFAAPKSLMWDTPRVVLPPRDRPQPKREDAPEQANQPRRQAAVGVEKDGAGLVLVPDQALLADPATSYPVVVDPGWYTPGPARWAVGYERTGQVYVGNANESETMSDGSWTGRPAKVGHTDDGNWNTRSYFQFDTGALAGADIISVTLKAPVVWSYAGCGGATTKHELWAMNQSFDALTFDPPKGYLTTNESIPAVHAGCTYSEAWFNTGVVNTTGPSQYLLKADDRVLGGNGSWRKYDSAGVKLSVNYNRRPDAPAEVRTDPPLPQPCRWCDGVPHLASDRVTLQARLTDPDNDRVKPVWRVSGEANDRVGGYLGSNNWFGETVDLTGRDGQRVSWTVRGDDGTAGGPTADGPGPFAVDRVKPAKPTVTGALYRDDNQWHGGVDVPGDFTFTAAAGSTNVDHYLYGWTYPPATKVDASALNGPATVRLAPEEDGPQTLYVQAVNRGDKSSDTQEYRVYVRSGNGPRAHYSFEGNAEDDAYLGDRDGTAAGSPTYVPGAVGSAIKLNGTSGTVTAASSVDTDKSFSVSAWVRLDQVGADGVVVAEDGSHTSGFRLGVLANGRWAFSMTESDSAASSSRTAVSAQPAQTGTWTHLTGVYSSTDRQSRLYVNGNLAARLVQLPIFNADRGVRIGSAKAADQVTGYFPGAIDEVGLYDRVLDVATIQGQVSHADVRAGHWAFDEGAGSTAGNSAGGQALVLSGGNAFTADGAINGGVHFDGEGGHASSSGPVVRTDTSLSVGAWVKLDAEGKDAPRTIVGQDGSATSGFVLRYRPADGGRWEFAMPRADAAGDTGDVVVSSAPAKLGVWTHVMGVFDATAGQLRLSVDGLPADPVAHPAGAWNAAGPLQVGCAKWAGQACANPFSGNVDELRVYSRALTPNEVQAIVAQANVTEGWWKFQGNTMDSSGRGRNATPTGTPGYTAGGYSANPDPKNLALSLNGRTDSMSAPHPVDTDKSFSVAAWVKLDKVGASSTAVSQDGGHVSGFFLEATPDGRWSFAATPADVAGQPAPDRVASPGLAQAGQWTHLVGVHDARAGQIELYVNGALAGSAPHRTAFNATGGLQVGRARANDESTSFFPGAIGDVRVYSRSMFAGEAAQLAGRDLSLVHNWRFDDNAADAVGARVGTAVGGASFGPGRTGSAAVFNGESGAVSTTGVDLGANTGFTVSTWVWLNDKGPYGSTYTAVSLDGEQNGKFQLGHEYDPDTRAYGDWFFAMPESAANGGAVTKAAVSTLPTEINDWVHLTGVYDASVGKLWLYVDGARVGDGTLNAPWSTSGGLQVGRGVVGGSYQRYWPGKVDDVRLYAGTLDPGRVSALFASYPAQDPPAEVPDADGRWAFDENTGTVAGDSVAGNDLALNGATWHGGRGTGGVRLDGTSAYAQTARPAVRTDQSFSMTGWAYRTGATAQRRTFLAQDGARVSSFQLYFDAGGAERWVVAVPDDDRDTPDFATLTSSVVTPRDAWSHLGLVYDAPAHLVKLYVNGQLVGARSGITINPADGPLSVGRARRGGQNADLFSGVVDDVRAYGRALSDGEVRAVHDDVPLASLGYWPMDDATGTTAKDTSYRHNDFALSGGTSWGRGPINGALRFNGLDGAGVAGDGAGDHLDTRTVSAWVKLDGKAKTGTAFAQDGNRTSGFVLQYRADLDRWVFAIPERDDDAAGSVSAVSDRSPVVGAWTHLVGVYDHGARQVRLYVDGRLAGVRDGAVGWPAGKLTVGRGKRQGQAADFFAGSISDVRVAMGVMPVEEVERRSTYPLPLGGQVGRFVNAAGDHYTAGDPGAVTANFGAVPAGYRFEAPLGLQPTGEVSGTRTLYACLLATDEFSSLSQDCEGQVKLGVAATLYGLIPPTGTPTLPVHRCRTTRDHFEANDPACEGVPGVVDEGLIGHTAAYAPLRRYYDPYTGNHQLTVFGGYPGYIAESTRGLVAMTQQPGTQPLYSCLRGRDEFSSLDAACEGAQVAARLGYLWTEAPAGQASSALYRCVLPYGGHLTTRSDTCEGTGVLPEKKLGYTLSGL